MPSSRLPPDAAGTGDAPHDGADVPAERGDALLRQPRTAALLMLILGIAGVVYLLLGVVVPVLLWLMQPT